MPIDSYVAKLDAQLATCGDWSEVEVNLPTPEADEMALADAMQEAFSQWLSLPDDPYQSGRFPDLGEPPEQSVQAWQAVLDLTNEPVVQARLGDLLWQLRAKPRPDQRAAIASSAYEQLADRWAGLDAKNALMRALQLTLAVGCDRPRAAALVASAVDRFDASIDNAPPGVSFGYLDVLVFAPPDLRSVDLASRFERAKTVYAAQTHYVQQLIDLQKHLAAGDVVQRAELDRESVGVYLRAAERSVGLESYLHLQSAVISAKNCPELRDIAMKRQRAFDLGSLEMQAIGVNQKFDPEVLRRHQDFLVNQGNWYQAMEKLLKLPPPSGREEANREEVQTLMEQNALRFAVTQHLVDAESGHARTLDAGDELDMQLGEIEVRNIGFEATFLLEPVLTRLPVRHQIERSSLRVWLLERCDGTACALVEESLWRWWNGENNLVCALLLIPAIESLVRRRAEERGVVVTTPAVGHRRAGFKSLGDLLGALSGQMDESWRRYLVCALVNEYGLNIRNDLCHGITLSASSSDVVVLMIAAIYLARMPATEDQENDDAARSG